jgi:hypothetical protein
LENDDANVSMAIQCASDQVKNLIQKDNWEEQNFMDSFNEGHTQLNLINQFDITCLLLIVMIVVSIFLLLHI